MSFSVIFNEEKRALEGLLITILALKRLQLQGASHPGPLLPGPPLGALPPGPPRFLRLQRFTLAPHLDICIINPLVLVIKFGNLICLLGSCYRLTPMQLQGILGYFRLVSRILQPAAFRLNFFFADYEVNRSLTQSSVFFFFIWMRFQRLISPELGDFQCNCWILTLS